MSTSHFVFLWSAFTIRRHVDGGSTLYLHDLDIRFAIFRLWLGRTGITFFGLSDPGLSHSVFACVGAIGVEASTRFDNIFDRKSPSFNRAHRTKEKRRAVVTPFSYRAHLPNTADPDVWQCFPSPRKVFGYSTRSFVPTSQVVTASTTVLLAAAAGCKKISLTEVRRM